VRASKQDVLGGQPIEGWARNPMVPGAGPSAGVVPVHDEQVVASRVLHHVQARPNRTRELPATR
jgi:hypothetical protein